MHYLTGTDTDTYVNLLIINVFDKEQGHKWTNIEMNKENWSSSKGSNSDKHKI